MLVVVEVVLCTYKAVQLVSIEASSRIGTFIPRRSYE